jgi:hypothetical protein
MSQLLRYLGYVLLAVLFCSAAFADTTGDISGSVKDSQGRLVPGATVTVINDATKATERTVSSSSDGLFSVTLLPPGTYIVNINAAGFKTFSQKVEVLLNQKTRLDAQLEVGGASETVEVKSQAAAVNTDNAVTGQPIDSQTLQALPLPVPNFMFLLSLSPGTAGEFPDVRSANRGIVDINVNGQRTSNNSVTLEGINVNDFNLAHFDTIPLPNPHALEEFNVATSLYDASSGTKGGGAVGLVFKSGTKNWHGEAYWQHRNDWLNANEWFYNQVGKPRQKFLQNVLGFSGSGPMPFLGGFWFGNVQGLRARNGVNPNGSSTTVNTRIFPTNPDGTTSAALLAPALGLTPGQIDPTALNILNAKNSYYGGTFLVPRAGQTGCAPTSATNLKCIFSQVSPQSDYQYTIAYDHNFFSKSKISGRWFYDNGQASLPFGTASTLAFPETNVQNNRFASIGFTTQISGRQLNEFHFGFSRFLANFVPTDKVLLADIGATRPNSSAVPGVYQVTVTGAFSLGTGVNDDRGTISNTFDFNDTWSIVLGKHTIKAGGGATRYQLNRFNRFAIRGALGFNSFTNFAKGQIDTLQAASGDPQRYFRDWDYDAFVQDDFKLLSNLTLNLGLRWDSIGFSHDLLERTTVYDPALSTQQPFLFASDVNLPGLTGTAGVGSCGARTCRTNMNFGPRAGFAWDVFSDHKTVVRGGYGIYFQRLSNQNFLQGSLGPPFFVQIATNTPGTSLANPLPNQPASGAVATAFIPSPSTFVGIGGSGTPGDPNDPRNFPLFKNAAGQFCQNFAPSSVPAAQQATNCSINLASFSTVPPSPLAPYNQQWNLGVQRDLSKGWILETAYVGSHYVHGLGIYVPWMAALASPSSPLVVKDANGVSYNITTNTANNEPLRVSALGLSRRRGARQDGNIGFAVYHSAQLSLSHHFQKGLYFQSAYTWSKSIDNVSGSQSTDELNATQAGQLGANVLNFANLDPALNRSIGDFDRRHRLVFSYVYEIPVPHSGFWGSQAFKGWSFSGINTYQSGLPFSVTDPNTILAFGGGTSTGNFLCGSISQAYATGSIQSQITAGTGYLNPACFGPSNIAANSANVVGSSVVSCPGGPVTANPSGCNVFTFGSIPRNAFRGPFQQNWDLGLAKRFNLGERQLLTFRVDAFNVLNHPVFRQPSFVSIGSATFGQINSTVVPARLLQLNAQYAF